MATIRQDAWTADDDLILAEVTLRHIREGGTQLRAFEEVGERIGRTAAACGFRWNSCVRKKYEAAIAIAKAQRQKRNQARKSGAVTDGDTGVAGQLQEPGRHDPVSEQSISIDAVIRFLRQWKHTYQDMSRQIKSLEKELRETQEKLAAVEKEKEELEKQVNSVQNDYRTVNDDYKTLIQIMDRARKLALLEESDEDKPRFKMDANGNLERID
jgi:prespore-specific regulator